MGRDIDDTGGIASDIIDYDMTLLSVKWTEVLRRGASKYK